MANYYEILGVKPAASQQEIKERYRFLANAYHPDKFGSETHKSEAEAEFKKINEAYQVLSVPAKRVEYDRRLGIKSSARTPKPPPRSTNSHQRQTTPRQSNNIYTVGQAIIRTIVFAFLFYIASFIAVRMGFGGVVLFLILLGIIYAKYFWK